MNIKQSILLIFTIIFIVLSASFIVFETMEIPKDQNAVIDSILEKISKEVKVGKLSNSTLEQLPANYFYAIWVENNDESWVPLIVDSNTSINASDGPTFIPTEYSWSARSYLKTVNDITFMVWINKYNSEFYIKNIILVSLFLLLFYLILVLVISLLFFDNNYPQNDYDDEYDEESIADEEADEQISDDLAKTQIMTKFELAQNIEDKKNNENEIKNQIEQNDNKIQKDNQVVEEEKNIDENQFEIDKKIEEKQINVEKSEEKENIQAECVQVKDQQAKNVVENQNLQSFSVEVVAKDDTLQESEPELEHQIDVSINELEDSDEISEEDGHFVYEHNIAGDEIKSVKFTDEEYDALTQPLDFSDCSDEDDEEFFLEEENLTKWKDLDLPKQAQAKHDALVDGYKRLWTKSIKMSDSFKAKFNFRDVKSLWRLGLSPKEYLESVLAIGLNYFGWDECCFYLKQEDKFLNVVSNEQLVESNIDIPTKGNKKGPMYVPLFLFNKEDLCGYLYFKWSKIDDFKLTDIMYYLKFIFCKECEFIFDQLLQETINTSVEESVQKKGEATFAMIVVDNKEKIEHDQDEVCVEQLSDAIYKKMKKHFKKFDVYCVSPLKYAIVGYKLKKEKAVRVFDKWISISEKNVYSVATLQNVALSFSCGVAFKSDNVDNLASSKNLIERAENLLRVSINNGGNKISLL